MPIISYHLSLKMSNPLVSMYQDNENVDESGVELAADEVVTIHAQTAIPLLLNSRQVIARTQLTFVFILMET